MVYKISYKKVFIQNTFESPHEGGLQGHSKFYDTQHKVEEVKIFFLLLNVS